MCKTCKILIGFLNDHSENEKRLAERNYNFRVNNASTIKDMIDQNNFNF